MMKSGMKLFLIRSVIIASIGLSLIILLFCVLTEQRDHVIKLKTPSTNYKNKPVLKTAEGLIPLDYIAGKGLWASKGLDLYFLPENTSEFIYKGTVPPCNLKWLLSQFSISYNFLCSLQPVFLKQLQTGRLLIISGGMVYLSEDEGKTFKLVKTLPVDSAFGMGVFRNGIEQNPVTGAIYLGEYILNPERKEIHIWKSHDNGETWNIHHCFPAGTIRHVHMLKYDPYENKIWFTTGDRDKECMIGYFSPNGPRIIGKGSQVWRTVNLEFFKHKIFWAMDGCDNSGRHSVVSFDRKTKTICFHLNINGICLSSCSKGIRFIASVEASLGKPGIIKFNTKNFKHRYEPTKVKEKIVERYFAYELVMPGPDNCLCIFPMNLETKWNRHLIMVASNW